MKALWTTLALAIALAPATVRAEAKGGVEEAKKGITETNQKFMAAVSKKDVATLTSLYTSDAIVMPPDMPAASGTKAIEELWKGFTQQGAKAATLTSEDVERSGDMAVETGVFTFTMEPEGKPAQVAKGKYVVVWKRQKDGMWKLHRDIWNSTPEAKK